MVWREEEGHCWWGNQRENQGQTLEELLQADPSLVEVQERTSAQVSFEYGSDSHHETSFPALLCGCLQENRCRFEGEPAVALKMMGGAFEIVL